MEFWIEMASTHSVSVVRQLLYHPQPIERLLRRVMKDVELQEVDVPLLAAGWIGH
jgi:hypothetical protein